MPLNPDKVSGFGPTEQHPGQNEQKNRYLCTWKKQNVNDMNKTFLRFMLATILIAGTSYSSMAANGIGFSRDKGTIGRIGVGAPTNFEIGVGYQFNKYFALTAEALTFSGLTSIAGVVDARWYMTKEVLTPYADAKLGFGLLGETLEYENYFGPVGSVTAGISWRRFDLGAGIIYDPFHKLGFTSSLTWTYNFRR